MPDYNPQYPPDFSDPNAESLELAPYGYLDAATLSRHTGRNVEVIRRLARAHEDIRRIADPHHKQRVLLWSKDVYAALRSLRRSGTRTRSVTLTWIGDGHRQDIRVADAPEL